MHNPFSFQIDGNFGGAAAIAEMLVQSSATEIRLLPALPDAWDQGKVNGICARGGFEISMEWEHHQLKRVSVYSKLGGTTTLLSGDKKMEISLTTGQKLEVNW